MLAGLRAAPSLNNSQDLSDTWEVPRGPHRRDVRQRRPLAPGREKCSGHGIRRCVFHAGRR